jgi:hypothetical protein
MSSVPAHKPDLDIEISVAWPIWAGGYPAQVEALDAVSSHVDELERLLSRQFTSSLASEVRVSVAWAVGDHVPVEDLRPESPGPNSLTLLITIEMGMDSPDARRGAPERLAGLVVSAVKTFVLDTMPVARSGADIYEVKLVRWDRPSGRITVPDEPGASSRSGRESLPASVLSISTPTRREPLGYGVALTDETALCSARSIDAQISAVVERAGGAGRDEPDLSASVLTFDPMDAGPVRPIGVLTAGVAVLRFLRPLPGPSPEIARAAPDEVLRVLVAGPDARVSSMVFKGGLERLASDPPPGLAVGAPVFGASDRAVGMVLEDDRVVSLA